MIRGIRRNWKVGDRITTTTFTITTADGMGAFYWVEVPLGMTKEQAAQTQQWHGPFETYTEAEASQRVVLFGEQSTVTMKTRHTE